MFNTCYSRRGPSTARASGAATVLAVLGGCVVAPVDGYDVGAPMVYTDGAYATPYYYNAPAYGNYYGAPYYYGTPYYGPAVSLGI